MKKVKRFFNLMRATLKDYQMSAKKFKILIQKLMLRQEKMAAIQILKEYVMKFMSETMKKKVRMNQIQIKNIIKRIIPTCIKSKLI